MTQLRLIRLATLMLPAVAAGLLFVPSPAQGQAEREGLIQIEVGDSIGLPLPDAKMEVFTVPDRGIFWEWIEVSPHQLPKGVHLLRFSHPGYKTSTFSVPLRDGSKVAVRVRLVPERDTVRKRDGMFHAYEVNAIAMSLDGRMKTDVLGHRRILDQLADASESNNRLGDLIRRTRGAELRVTPGSAGSYFVSGELSRCQVMVMLNGDRRHIIPFATFDQMYSTNELEAIEVFPRGPSIPLSYQVTNARCGLLIVWYRKY
jgi:hypothetical protein